MSEASQETTPEPEDVEKPVEKALTLTPEEQLLARKKER